MQPDDGSLIRITPTDNQIRLRMNPHSSATIPRSLLPVVPHSYLFFSPSLLFDSPGSVSYLYSVSPLFILLAPPNDFSVAPPSPSL